MLFSDITGYTAMSEKLDPEEVKEITSRIFSICGPAGTGKSRLVEEFKARLDLKKAFTWKS